MAASSCVVNFIAVYDNSSLNISNTALEFSNAF